MKEITVVIPNYNGIRYMEGCLKALYEQEEDTPEYEIIVVDNGSTDGSAGQVEEHFPQIQLIRLEENTGFCHAVNVGIEACNTPFVLLLNNDTKVRPGFIKALYQAVSASERIFSVSAKMLMWDKPELLDDAGDQYCVLGWAYSRGKAENADESRFNIEQAVFSACAGAAIYRRSVMDQIGLFDENHFAYLEDLDIGYRARVYGFYNIYQPKAQVLHFGSASSGSRYNDWKTGMAAANSIYVIYKNMPLLQLVWNFPFLLAGFVVKYFFFCKKGMGGPYRRGLLEGIKRCTSQSGRIAKIPFQWRHLGNYIKIQLLLYLNTFRFLMKS